MCTSIALKTHDFYFGRTMDLEYNFNESVVFTPRNYPLPFRKVGILDRHYAILGMAAVSGGYPLYADAVNERGLCIAGLNFPDNAYYPDTEDSSSNNISPFELILWILGKCASIAEAKKLLSATHLVSVPFSSDIPLTPLHWHIADSDSSIVLESTRDGMKVYDNPVGVLTNNPGFHFQTTNLCQYMNLVTGNPKNCFTSIPSLIPFGQGLGCFGLPGDFSPASRFVKAAYMCLNSVCNDDEMSSISQAFHILDSVSLVKGSVITSGNLCDITTYSCCMNATKGFYYYKTYENSQFTAIDMQRENLESDQLRSYPLTATQQVVWAN
ncbi:choloylglycine hydrolase [Parablautia muri]|uniref:choloylglycine hydrolase n=1 Tax=Parablautia muri TaxID=2320879 RepID=A0A9X5BI69_9FIRM|nr:choloylglycine hydrolase [Parablautia muri]NBJ94124.1 linear amide C-N hydrolase [Parablautia muri]